jgi:hypothetical protein
MGTGRTAIARDHPRTAIESVTIVKDGSKVTRYALGSIDKIPIGINRSVATLWSANRPF